MTRVGTALAAAVALLSVSACTGEEPAGGDPTTSAPSPPATSSPTPTPAAPTIPPEATEHSADGAAAFVKYYYSLINYAAVTGDTSHLESASGNDCRACERLVKRYAALYAEGGHSEDPQWTPTITSSQLAKGDFYVTADVRTGSYLYKPDAGSPATRMKAGEYHDLFRLDWTGSGWVTDLFMEQETPQ